MSTRPRRRPANASEAESQDSPDGVTEFLTNKGIACFSERNDSLLMWGHYGGSSRGFCLEFYPTHDPFTKVGPVNYSDRIPKLNLADVFLKENAGEQMMEIFRTKSKDWAYEREWRSIHDKAGTFFHYGPGALKAVYFGPEISASSLEIVCLIVNG